MTLDDISGKGDSYDFREGGSSEDWEIKEGRNDRRETQVWQADVTREMQSCMPKAKNCR